MISNHLLHPNAPATSVSGVLLLLSCVALTPCGCRTYDAAKSPKEVAQGLQSDDVLVRRSSASALCDLSRIASQKDSVKGLGSTLTNALQDRDSVVQTWIALTILNCDRTDKSVLPTLIHLLSEQD